MNTRPFWITAGIAALFIMGVTIYAVRGPAILLELGAAGRLLCL